MDNITLAYLKVINENTQIDEELTHTQKYSADKMRDSGHDFHRQSFLSQHPLAEHEFKTQGPKEGRYRARFPVTISDTKGSPDSDVRKHLQDLGYNTDHELYHKGLATKETTVGNPDAGIPYSVKHVEHKIGGILEKHSAPDDIKKKFMNDKFRKSATTKDYDMILTGHHHDIYGGSTGRGWISCASMESTPKWPKAGSGPAAKCMSDEIQNQTHHVYLVPRGGNIDTDAIARTSLKIHKDPMSGHTTLFPEGTVHGEAPPAFVTHAKALSDRLFTKKPGAVYIKNADVYHDGGKRVVSDGQATPESLDAAWKTTSSKDKDAMTRHTLSSMVDPDAKYSSKGLRDVAKSLKVLKNGVDSGDFTKATDAIWHAHLNIPEGAHHHMYDHPVIKDAQEKLPELFNMHAAGHVHALAHLPKHTGLGSFQYRIANQLPDAKNVEDYKVLSDLNDRGIHKSGESYKIRIDPKHTMGKDPMKAIIDHHVATGDLDHKKFTRAYMSTHNMGKNRGNLYDQAVHFEGESVPGMSDVVNSISKRLVHGDGHWITPNDKDTAHTFSIMKPATRQRIADAAGIDHKALMKTHKSYIDGQKAKYAEILSKYKE